jgi:hypothetical protein
MGWAIIGIVLLLIVLFLITMRRVEEGFTTVDLPTITAQRQQLQWEGERRYNSLARLQAPKALISPAEIQAAVQQVVPVPTTHATAQQTLLGAVTVGGQDDGTGKTGQGVEQTGMVAEKIKFCESLKSLDCSQLNDPRLAECGLCLDGGKDSKGKFHRGGMYISSDDQIRAGEVASATGTAAAYSPTVGTCPAKNFVLMQENCMAREGQLACLKTAAPTSTNICGQCYGGASGYKGTLLVGKKPASYQAYLNVSHPGSISVNGYGVVVSDGQGNNLGGATASQQAVYNPQVIPLTLTEGQNLVVTIYGPPPVWCAWFSDVATGQRTVSLDIGVQSITPSQGDFAIAGDKNAAAVQNAFVNAPGNWQQWITQTVPNTVLWYARENMPAGIQSAWYGTTPPTATSPNGYDVTPAMQVLAATGTQTNTVSNTTFANVQGAPPGGDPAPGVVKHLWITYDDGSVNIMVENSTFTGAQIGASVTMNVTVPATLVAPMIPDDLAACPASPMIFTEIGAGLMSSHSCFKADGSFNPTQYCLAEIFTAAGGTQQGTAYPSSASAAAALVQNDSTGKPSLDATAAYLNNQASIATYGVDTTGKQADWATFVAASKAMLGTAPTNPCDGPKVNTGPYSPECIDYLYRTSGTTQYDGASVDPNTLPYGYCSAKGTVAPLNADGTPNTANIAAANQQGNMTAIRAYYQNIFNGTQNSSDFYAQAAAMESCYNSIIQPPPETAAACPPPNPDEWHCMDSSDFQQPEVFMVSTSPQGAYTTLKSNADAVCETYGARVATKAELTSAQQNGAQWCSAAWVADDDQNAYYPMQQSINGCGASSGIQTFGGGWLPNTNPTSSDGQNDPSTAMANVTCFGVKPPAGTQQIYPFSGVNGTWNAPNVNTMDTSDYLGGSAAVGFRINPSGVQGWNGQGPAGIQCTSRDNTTCANFPTKDACVAWTQNPSSDTTVSGYATVANTSWNSFTPFIDTYIRQQV